MMWGQTYEKFRLESVLSGRSLLATVLSTIVTGLIGTPWLQEHFGAKHQASQWTFKDGPNSSNHSICWAGYLDTNKTLNKVIEQFYWQHMRNEVRGGANSVTPAPHAKVLEPKIRV
jgi:hypothetical protein